MINIKQAKNLIKKSLNRSERIFLISKNKEERKATFYSKVNNKFNILFYAISTCMILSASIYSIGIMDSIYSLKANDLYAVIVILLFAFIGPFVALHFSENLFNKIYMKAVGPLASFIYKKRNKYESAIDNLLTAEHSSIRIDEDTNNLLKLYLSPSLYSMYHIKYPNEQATYGSLAHFIDNIELYQAHVEEIESSRVWISDDVITNEDINKTVQTHNKIKALY